jgi:histidinol-phosphate aminotransferase
MPARIAHGGIQPAELRALGIAPSSVLDFSASVSPLPPPLAVREALLQTDLAKYPDPECTELRAALAARDGVHPDQILVGNGSVEIIHLLAQIALGPGDVAVVFAPAFGEYGLAASRQGAAVREIRAQEADDFRWRLANVPGQLHQAQLVFLGNPNNPTGVYLTQSEVAQIAQGSPGLLLLDEAYRPFVDHPWESRDLARAGKVVLLRSLTKDYGLAGVRLGYCVAVPAIIEQLRAVQLSWSVNALAQAGGVAALRHPEHVEHVRLVVQEAKQRLCAALAALRLRVIAGSANFVLVQTGEATRVRRRLLGRGILVRDCTSFGLPAYIRIGIRTWPECQRLVAALAETLEEHDDAR